MFLFVNMYNFFPTLIQPRREQQMFISFVSRRNETIRSAAFFLRNVCTNKLWGTLSSKRLHLTAPVGLVFKFFKSSLHLFLSLLSFTFFFFNSFGRCCCLHGSFIFIFSLLVGYFFISFGIFYIFQFFCMSTIVISVFLTVFAFLIVYIGVLSIFFLIPCFLFLSTSVVVIPVLFYF